MENMIFIFRYIKESLSRCVNYEQNGWISKLPAFIFSYNNTVNIATKFTPFYLANGFPPATFPQFITPLKKHYLATTFLQQHICQYTNISAKFMIKYGLIEMESQRDEKPLQSFSCRSLTDNITLDIPQKLKIRNVFHDECEPVYKLEKILNVKKYHCRFKLVKWVCYGPEHNSWLQINNFGDIVDLLCDFHNSHPRNITHNKYLLSHRPSAIDNLDRCSHLDTCAGGVLKKAYRCFFLSLHTKRVFFL
ncbi:hypothetical protein HDU92_006200 [Lobulomyces angularis]|nr:hypothetical protein HDU92_006200 [Lobulomyces angularis]